MTGDLKTDRIDEAVPALLHLDICSVRALVLPVRGSH